MHRFWARRTLCIIAISTVLPKAHVQGSREDYVEIVIKRDRFLHQNAGSSDSCTVTISPVHHSAGEHGIEERTLLVVRASDGLADSSTVNTTTSPGRALN